MGHDVIGREGAADVQAVGVEVGGVGVVEFVVVHLVHVGPVKGMGTVSTQLAHSQHTHRGSDQNAM